MIGSSVKARLGPLCAAVVLGTLSCAQRPAPVRAEPAATPVQPGAQGWSDGALLLPAGSPAVVTVRLEAMLEAARRFKTWVLAEPAMLGPDGENLARTIDRGWLAATAYMGVDPLMARAWTERGVDPARPIHVGFYPVEPQGARFASAVDNILREELGLAPGAPVSSSLRQLVAVGGQLPEGTYARITRSLATANPVRGVRAVIPLAGRDDFLNTAGAFIAGLGFTEFSHEVRTSERELCFSSESGLAALSIRVVEGHAVVDALLPPFGRRPGGTAPAAADLKLLHARLQEALTLIPSGRPHAPTPAVSSAIAVSFDQLGTADLVRLMRYEATLEEVGRNATQRRDAELLLGLDAARAEVDAWQVGGRTVTGTTFELIVPPPGAPRIGTAAMTLFGRKDLPVVDTSRVAPTLDLPRRNIALAVDLGVLRSDGWQAWFAGETGVAVHELEVGDGPLSSYIPWIRASTLLLSNLGDPPSAKGVAADVAEVVAELDSVARIEVVGLGRDLAELRRVPRLLIGVTLEGSGDAAATSQSQSAILGGLAALFGELDDVPTTIAPALEPGVTIATPIGETVVAQHLKAGSPAALILGIGLTPEELDVEIAAMGAVRRVEGAVAGRLEPIALLSLLRGDDAAFLDPIDLDILAQRLGALTLTYGTPAQMPTPAMRLELSLEAPPRL